MQAVGAPHNRVLLVEDDKLVRACLSRFLRKAGFVVAEADTCALARELYRSFEPHVVLTDHRLPDGDGITLVAELRRERAATPMLVLTGHGTIDLAVRAMKSGAETMLTKPIELPRLILELKQAIAAEIPAPFAAAGRVGGTAPAPTCLARSLDLERIKDLDCSLLLLGESGVGKTCLARWLHHAGVRRGKAFVVVSCEELTAEDLEVELFGCARGALASAHTSKAGVFESADGGTLVLDEVGDLPAAVQTKVLEVIQGKRVRRLGSVRERPADVRVLATTRRDVREPATSVRMRSELFQVLGGVTITIPSLRDRRAEIPALAREILASVAMARGRVAPELTPDADAALASHAWPGNVRELTEVLERALERPELEVLSAGDLPIDPVDDGAPASSLRDLERSHIERALAQCGHVGEAARRLGISRSSLYVKLKAYGLLPVHCGRGKGAAGGS